ncbi:MAG: DUF6095 family protein [Flavobacteriaceae bacterium]|jgi:hypothetical protein|nr:DUF6095 family protein [Flavobacteriaceae bacterium]MDG1791076.1 DUF6095 family protein [Flavobacteriaceae bacterium]MDG2447928.1 DUF6095 family protein [Flavobacteriaceae bacterium]|tara:strand:+ start:261 stop:488 length:228 start_codon:yes stop_codon:yes gene_type:complete
MNQKHTNPNLLKKGIKYLAYSLPLLFLSPYVLTLSFINKETVFFYLFFVAGLIVGFFALYFLYKGIQTLLSSLFN